jgi:hyperosmotically inducible periplasmic protein
MQPTLKTLTAAAVLAMTTLAACNRPDTPNSVGAGTTLKQTEPKTNGVGAEAPKGAAQVGEASRELAPDAKQAGSEGADKVSDAVITSAVKAELVKDPSLSALKVNVDTEAGRVVLQGSAPTPATRDQAMRLAMTVKGVVSVDNQLKVEPGKG